MFYPFLPPGVLFCDIIVDVPLSLGAQSGSWRYLRDISIVKIGAGSVSSWNLLTVNEPTPTSGIEETLRRMAQLTILDFTGPTLGAYFSLMMELASLFHIWTVCFEKNWAWSIWSIFCHFDLGQNRINF